MENPYKEQIQKENTYTLVYHVHVDSFSYQKEYISGAIDELKKRNYDFSRMTQNLYIEYVVKDFPTGWRKTLRKMFEELSANGWTNDVPLNYKYSWGEFVIKGFRAEANSKCLDIYRKYKEIFHLTCNNCSSIKKVEHFNDEYLCQKCIISNLQKNRITKINAVGFRYYETSLKKLMNVNWQEIKKIEIEGGEGEYWLNLSKIKDEDIFIDGYVFDPTQYLPFNSYNTLNFFKVLKKIPSQYLSSEQNEVRNRILNLQKCLVCTRRSVLDDKCIICRSNNSSILFPSNSQLKRFKTIDGIIKNKKERFRYYLSYFTEVRYRYKTDSSFK
ncbi:hypothetical protein LPB85_10210 [Chryseobacterium sp. LC2016-27]|jgi:hypothetical protein|uniref:hypothetical protein n=1 Tax=Chryseobacterium sp. LC2016-27 TaxID=2897326 RepID=UPI001E608C06|nr:hypothetical protein [Chryseobacterium sp. LC2016-27]MCD0455805.1 hypothetical protein [Chryseobacterium sp. LC2016-27]